MTTTAATTPIKADTPAPATSPPRPLLTRLHLWLRLWTLKLTIRTLLSTVRFFKIKGYGVLQPTYRKTYPIGARLTNEVWIPSSWKPGQSLPLYIDIHGGGFALGDPFHDDGWCNYLAEKQNICVVSCAEYDVLCNEALEAARLFAAAENAETVSGNVEEDDRQGVESWRKGGVWWEMVKGAQHGFNYIRKKEVGAERERERITKLAYERAAAWLKREIYA
ncbi:hypothetical protein D6D13_06505 [Aureobasidium pullulans]|uniref:Alpha/beta hydrolase fold-3 domain-containing protein n=1 Tax=Aureobasidium pullulans TaxID=5580 RepID=A0A4S9CGX6_AURPU|nr:hypothetical protein D6D13_06505 [Aureobasidium pullulans]